MELSDAELRLVCVALSFLRASYQEDADYWKAASLKDASLTEMAHDNAASADRLAALRDRLTPLLKR